MISVITPTYNEKENIRLFIANLSAKLKAQEQKYEIIIVDDNSPDGTSDIVKTLKRKHSFISLINRPVKRGIGSAYHDGFLAAKGDILIGIDADLSQSLGTIPLFIQKIKEGNHMVIGSRYLPLSKIYNQSLYKRFGSRLFNLITKWILNIPNTDITHSYRAFTKKSYLEIAKQITEGSHPSFFIECTFWIKKRGFASTEVATTFKERKLGRSKLKLSEGLKNAIKTLIRLRKLK